MPVPLFQFLLTLSLLGLILPAMADPNKLPMIEISQLEQQAVRAPAQYLVTVTSSSQSMLAETAFRLAELALCRAKQNGGNQCLVTRPGGADSTDAEDLNQSSSHSQPS
jgi:hypothetical protein